jgi:flagellar hook protein FlgE
MTCQGDSYVEYNLAQNGYTFGYLSSINVDADAVISGVYSNGKTLELYQIALYNFPSLQNLRHEGNNLYSETAASGTAVCGEAGTGQFGTTESYRLEQSNVDLSAELVNMIVTQRGFQANSKSITTVDTMLETVIGMKR